MSREKQPSAPVKAAHRSSSEAAAPLEKGPPDLHARDGRGAFPVVAIGASAGGLGALKSFFKDLPQRSGLAFLVVQHLDPNQPSMLVDLLSGNTAVPVVEAEDGATVQVDHVYVGPPNRVLTVRDGRLRLDPVTDPRGRRYPIDALFRSVAEDCADHAVGVILSGTGMDGTAGLASVKDRGGVVAVQEPATAEFDGMPQSAIDTGLADLVLAPGELAAALARFADHGAGGGDDPDSDPAARDRDLASVLALLRARSSFDFRSYKSSMLWRRVQRRMGLTNIRDLPKYLAHLGASPEELQRLRKEVLISVTGFFRDAEAFDELLGKAIRPMVSGRGGDDAVRVWVPGCATGEEAYSLAMLLHEERARSDPGPDIQIFATDLDEEALAVARAAQYPENVVLTQVPEDRVARFFSADPEHAFRVTRELRESIVFATHNLLADPPFSRLDLISCRNVLIYLQPEAQKRILGLFHAALKPGGILFLGSAEGVSVPSGFEPLSPKWRIYRRVGPNRAAPAGLAFAPTGLPKSLHPRPGRGAPAQRVPGVHDMVMDVLLEEFAPAAVVVNARSEALFLHGPVNKFLDLPRGDASLEFMAMVRPHLRAPVRVVLNQAMREGQRVDVTHSAAPGNGHGPLVRVGARPLRPPDAADPLWLVTFEVVEPLRDRSASEGPREDDEGLLGRLEAELAAAKAELQTTIEAYESSNEAARASHEEMMSMNEEFRSTNEELETSKEELQSLNEELSSVNNQLKEKVHSLETTTNDLHNLLSSTEVATVFLDREFRIRRFTPATRRLLNLLPADVGRPFGDIAPKFRDEALLDDVEHVLHDLAPIEKEVRTDDGRWYMRRVLPYRTQDNRIEGTVVTFLDVDAQKRTEVALREAKEYAESIIATLREPLVILDKDLRVRSANQSFYAKFGTSPATTEGRFIFDLGSGQWDVPRLRQLLEETLPRKSQVDDFEVTHDFEGMGRRTMRLNARRLIVRGVREAKEVLVLLSIEDVTTETEERLDEVARKEALEHGVQERTAELLEANRILRQTNEALDAFSWVVGHDLKEPVRAVEILLADVEQRQTELPADVGAAVASARRQNRRLADLVGGLLEFSRAARVDLGELESVAVAEVLESPGCATRYATRLKERNARLEGPDPAVQVRATPASLAQILGNLVLNAVAHNPGQDPWVRVRAGPAQQSGMVEIVVEDNGPGFSAAVRKGFTEGGDTTHGGGFGLAIARRAVYHLGGRMWLGSSPEGGAAVHFTLSAPIGKR